MKRESIYIFNPDYLLHKDKNRIVLTNRSSDPSEDDFIGFAHPVYAIILSLFDGEKCLTEVIEQVSQLMNLDLNVIKKIVEPLLENQKPIQFQYEKWTFSFPKRVLVEKCKSMPFFSYNPQEFFIPRNELDLETWRLNYPLDTIFMVNTNCVTNCSYCYADRSRNIERTIPIERLKNVIREARHLNMRTFDLTGGELFLYDHWEELLAELLANDFHPYISTKHPIDLQIIKKLKELGIRRIQISIDSIVNQELKALLQVKENYLDQIQETFHLLDENDIDIYTNTQLTSVNTGHFDQLIEYLLGLKNIKSIRAGVAGFSLYKSPQDYNKLKPKLDDVKRLERFAKNKADEYMGRVSINFSGYALKEDIVNQDKQGKIKKFSERSRCSGNFYGFIILPDGKVTICEELYWHPAFIIGDLNESSIEEMWQSKKAQKLYNLSREVIREESACRNCDEFDPCHKRKGVCWKEVLYAYGYDNWDFPDPKCPHAPEPYREFYM